MKTQLIDGLSMEFAKLHFDSRSLIHACSPALIYRQPFPASGLALPSIGESVLRSATTVEQTCGGITANLWDDGFEWTLPETLNTPERILEYLDEVEATRKRAFSSVLSDEDLLKTISTPTGKIQTLASLLFDTLARACRFQGQAALTAEIISAQNTAGFKI